MKIKIEVELDTKEDSELGYELLEILRSLKERIDQVNEEYENG